MNSSDERFQTVCNNAHTKIISAIREASEECRLKFRERFPGGQFECIHPDNLAGVWTFRDAHWSINYNRFGFCFQQDQRPGMHHLSARELDEMLELGRLKYLPPRAED